MFARHVKHEGEPQMILDWTLQYAAGSGLHKCRVNVDHRSRRNRLNPMLNLSGDRAWLLEL